MKAVTRAVIVLLLAVAHVAVAVLLYYLRTRVEGSVFGQDVYAFGLPFVVASAPYFTAFIVWREGVPSDRRIVASVALAIFVGALVQLTGMAVAFNCSGT